MGSRELRFLFLRGRHRRRRAGVAPLRKLFQAIDYGIWIVSRGLYDWFQRLTGAERLRASSDIEVSHDDIRRDNALLGAISSAASASRRTSGSMSSTMRY